MLKSSLVREGGVLVSGGRKVGSNMLFILALAFRVGFMQILSLHSNYPGCRSTNLVTKAAILLDLGVEATYHQVTSHRHHREIPHHERLSKWLRRTPSITLPVSQGTQSTTQQRTRELVRDLDRITVVDA